MKRKFTVTLFSLFAVLALAAWGDQNAKLVDDFNDGDAVGWDQNDFTGQGVFDASSGEYAIYAPNPIAIDDPSQGGIESHWALSNSIPSFANGTFQATIRANSFGTTMGFLIRDSERTENDYAFYGSTSFGTFYIEKFLAADTAAPQKIIAMADPSKFPFQVGVNYNISGSVVGNRISMKFWKVGDPEPSEPQLVVRDKDVRPGVGSRISVYMFFDRAPLAAAGVTEVYVGGAFDNISFTPGASH
jgi:hypothetical protein